jgi:hypothetical protein
MRPAECRPVDGQCRAALEGLNGELGERRVCELLGLSIEAHARALAGLPVRRATAVVIETGIARYRASAAAVAAPPSGLTAEWSSLGHAPA